MLELFRYIEHAFVVPSTEDDSIDVSTDTDFQQGLRDAIEEGANPDLIRERATAFLDGVLNETDGNGLSRLPEYHELRKQLLALPDPTTAEVNECVQAVFDSDAGDLVTTDQFRSERTLLNDVIVAVKLTTGFDKADVNALAAMLRAIAFLEDFAAGRVTPLTHDEIRNRLGRPMKIPQVFLLKADPGRGAPPPSPPPPDPEIARRAEVLKHQAALQGAYETLMRLHPSQLEIRAASRTTTPPPDPRECPPPGTTLDREGSLTGVPRVLGIPARTLHALDPVVRATIDAELPDASTTSMPNIVDVVKRKWIEVSREVEPYKVPAPARTYRLGLHLFAIQEAPAEMAMEMVAMAAPDFSSAITRPVGIGNLQVVRQELVGYEPAEISHIENVLPGELMRRVTRREETQELIITEETETTQSEERDLQTTQRNELATETSKEASQQSAATQDQTTTTNYGKLVENSKTNYARSVTDRAVNKLTQMVKRQRVQREKKVFSDKAVHELNNTTGADSIRGIYQWVDKKYKTRILNYGKRLLYDVVVPEPAAFLIDALKKASQPENFQLVRPSEPGIFPSNLNASNYMYWAAQYGVSGSVTPPPDEFTLTVAHPDSQDVAKTIQAYGGSWFGQFYKAFSIHIPENYRAVGGYVQRTNVEFATSQPKQPRQFEFYVGEHYFLRFGQDDISSLNHSFTMNGETGDIPVTMKTFSPIVQFNFAIGINCQRTDKALEQWQLKTHAAVMAGYQRQRAEYLDQLGRYQAAVRTQMATAHKFAHDAAMERQELKKAFIHLLMSEHFGKVFIPTPNPHQIPPDPMYVKNWGAIVAFFERAFEWENLMYVYYPYFWGRRPRWGELILTQDADMEFEAFLKAGAARVVVPARPGFEAALAHYHETGDVWMGEEIPDMFSNMYVSIIAEIKARNAAPDDVVCVAEWDVRLPTTLVMLKEDSALPAWTPARDCVPPPEL